MQLWLLVVFVAGALAGPINIREISDDTTCARTCVGSNKFRYSPGMTYEFDYNVVSETTMEGADADRVSVDVRAVADIEVLSQCDFALKLRDVSVYDTSSSGMRNMDQNGAFRAALEKNTLRFSYQDGVIEDLCPADDEVTWALNFKRGVLSSIQNSMDNLEKNQVTLEADVTGKCNTDYKVVNRGWYTTTIKKSKDLIGCTDRHGYRSALQATPYRVPSKIQSLPLLKSTHVCEQELGKNGRLQKTICQELHMFRPFSRVNSGAVTKVTQKLNFKQERRGVFTNQGVIGRRVTIHFEHAYGQPSLDKTKQDAISKLEEICAASKEDIRPEVPEMFSQLVYIMKNLDITSMRDIYSRLTRKSLCRDNNVKTRKFFFDALPMIGTDASVRMMKELLFNKDVTDYEAKMWITSLAFIQNPTAEMLQEAKTLLESDMTSDEALLPVSTMVNNYCSQKTSCQYESAVSAIIATLERNIGTGCFVSENKLDKVLRTLRALGNAGHIDIVSGILSTCFLRSGNQDEVRVAAVDAYRRLPCSVDRSDLLNLYEDKTQDSELRVAAYIAVMQCPSDSVLRTIKRTLEVEKANQVGSFVWSHLTNLMESSNPHKQGIRNILENDDLKKEFDLEKIKYSRNYEGSFFIEKFNTGAMVESNLIWSGKSFIPRSAMVNLTVDLFGNSMNLFEMGGRVEGLEYLLETYLGPYGYFGDKKAGAKNNAGLDQIRASMYMRMFGNEMAFMHTKGVGSLHSLKNFRFMDLLNKASSTYDHHFTQSIMFLDSSVIVPTVSGLPLNLTVNGTATIDLKAVGTVNLKKITASPSSILIDGEFKPSGSVQMTGIMSVDAFVTKIGMKVVNTWHSSTAVRGRIELNRGKVLSVELEMPQEKMEILDVRTAFFSLNGDSVRKQKMLETERKTIKLCSGSRLATVTGLEICSEFNYVNASMRDNAPYFPFTGPFSMEIALFKRDTHRTYKLLAKRTETSQSSIAQLALNTPGSKVDRNLALDFELNFKRKHFEISLTSPWKKVSARGDATINKNHWALSGGIVLDGHREYSVDSEMKINKQKDKVMYKPRLTIVRSGTDNIILSGILVTEKNKIADLEMSLSGIRKHPVIVKATATSSKYDKTIKTSMSFDPKKYYTMAAGLIHETNSKRASFKFVPTLKIESPTSELIALVVSADYREGKSFKGDISVSSDELLSKPVRISCLLKESSGKRTKYTGTFSIKSKSVTAKGNGIVDCKNTGTSVRILINYNIKKLSKNRITFNSKYTDRSTKSLKKYKLSANMETEVRPEFNFHTEADFTHSKTNTEASLDFVYGANKKKTDNRISSSVMLNHVLNKKAASLDYNLRAKYLPLNIDAQLKGNHKHDSKYLTSAMTYTNGKTIKLNAGLNLKDESKNLMRLSGDFNLDFADTFVFVSTELNQPSKKQFNHDITWKVGKTKSSIFTKYQKGKSDSYKFSTDIHMSSRQPIKITVSTDLDYNNFKAAGQIMNGKEKYGMKTAYKYSEEPRGKFMFDLMCPERQITVDIDGGKQGLWYEGQIDAKWNVNRNNKDRLVLDGRLNWNAPQLVDGSLSLKYPSRVVRINVKHTNDKKCTTHADLSWNSRERINFDGSVSIDMTPSSRNMDVSMQLQTPFSMMKRVKAEFGFVDNNRAFSSKASYSRNGVYEQMATNFNINKPITRRNIDIFSKVTTTLDLFKTVEVQITHQLDSKLITKVKGSLDNTNIDVSLAASAKGDSYRRDVEASLALKSNIPKMEYAALRVSHNDDGRKFVTDVAVDFNGRKWLYDLDMTHYWAQWQLQNNGKLTFSTPYGKTVSIWVQRITDKDIKSTFSSDWGQGEFIRFDFAGNLENVAQRWKINSNMILQTPWMPVRDIEFELTNEYGSGLLHSSTRLNQNRRQKWNAVINIVRSSGQVDFDMNIISPFADEITGKLNSRHNSYPMTGHVDLSWSPEQRVSADGSVNIQSLSNISGNIRITTPFRNAEKLVLQIAQKKKGSEYISTGTIQYGLRDTIEIETRVQLDSRKRMWTKIYTPFEDFKDIEAGIEFFVESVMISGKSKVSIKPVFGTLSGHVSYDWGSDLEAKLRLDTPFVQLPYLQMHASRVNTPKGQHINVEAMYDPRKTITMDVTYDFKGPLYLKASGQSPYEYLEQASVLLRHAKGFKIMQTSAEITYGRDAKLSGEMKMNWDKDIDGSLVVTTPFPGYEYQKVSAHHEGDINDMKCHVEIEMFGENLLDADVVYQNGNKRSGYLSVSSSRFDKAKVKVSTRGDLNNFRATSSVTYGYKKMLSLLLQNKLSSRKLNSVLALKTWYMDDLNAEIEYDGNLSNFHTKVSGSLGSDRINSETSFTLVDSSIDLTTTLQYNINRYGKHLSLSVRNSGDLDDFSASAIAQMDNDQVQVRGTFSTRDRIQGSLTVQTPVDSFRETGFSFTHRGSLSSFVSEGQVTYMDGKDIKGKIKFSMSDPRRPDVKVEVQTPFMEYEKAVFEHTHHAEDRSLTSNTAFSYGYNKKITSDVTIYLKPFSLDLMIKTPFNGFEITRAVHNHAGTWKNFNSHSEIEVGEKHLQAETGFNYGTNTNGNFVITSNIDQISNGKLTFKSNDDLKNLESIISVSLNEMTFEVEANNQLTDRKLLTAVSITTPYTDKLMLNINHRGKLSNFNSKASVAWGFQIISAQAALQTRPSIHGTVTLHTPFENFRETGFTVNHSGDLKKFDFDGTLNYMDGKSIEANINHSATGFGRYENGDRHLITVITIKTPFTDSATLKLKHTDDDSGFNTAGTASHGNDEMNIVLQRRLEDASVKINTPFASFRDIGASVRFSGDLNRFSAEGHIQYMDGKSINSNISGSANSIHNIDINIEIRTPYSTFGQTVLQHKHNIHEDGFALTTELQSERQQKLFMDITGTLSPIISINAVLKTPFSGYENNKLIVSHENSANVYKSNVQIETAGKTASLESLLSSEDTKTASLAINTNIDGIENMKTMFTSSGELTNFKIKAELSLNDKKVEAEISNRIGQRSLDTSVLIKTPITDDIIFNVVHNGRSSGFTCKASASVKRDVQGSFSTMYSKRGTILKLESDVDYVFERERNRASFKLFKEGSIDDLMLNVKGKLNRKTIEVNSVLKLADNMHGEIKLRTPFSPFRNTGLSFDHSGNTNQFQSEGWIKYMDDKQVSGKINHYNYLWKRIESNIEINTPIIGYEFTKADFRHTAEENSMTCSAGVYYGRGQEIVGEMTVSLQPNIDFSLKAKTPFSGYERMSADATYTGVSDKYVLDGNVDAGNGNKFSLNSHLDLSGSPLTASVKIGTPFSKFDTMDFSITHSGTIPRSTTKVSFNCPCIGNIDGGATIFHTSLFDFHSNIYLNSDIRYLENLAFNAKSSETSDTNKFNADIAWAPRKQITLESSYTHSSWNGNQYATEIYFTSPFSSVSQFSMKAEHEYSANKYNGKTQADLNGETIFDTDVDYAFNVRHEASVNMRKPKPMRFTLSSLKADDRNIDSDLYFNWDRDEPFSNIRFQTVYNDNSGLYNVIKDLKVKLIHPSRTVGIIGSVVNSVRQTKSQGELIWDEEEGQKLSYDFSLNDRSRRYSKMYDGNLKFGLPMRSLKMSGSYSDNVETKSVDGSFFWDVDRDQSKEIGMKAILSPNNPQKTADFTLRLPSFGKDVKLGTEVMVNEGRTLFNGKTSFSYSPDTRKTLTLLSKLEDISSSGSTNYSLILSVSHPYTDVDAEVKSLIGWTSDKYSTIIDLSYLTARREMKNLALRAEIDRLRKQINLEMNSPERKMEVTGNIKDSNPYQITVTNRLDGDNFVTHFSLDTEKRSMNFQTNYDTENPRHTFHVEARYINDSAVQATAYHRKNYRQVDDSLFTARLNTSRLLHTRIHWRSNIVSDFQGFMMRQVTNFGDNAVSRLNQISSSFGEELEGKYRRITSHISEEVRPLIDSLATEMEYMERQMMKVMQEVRRMHNNNEFYLQDMGQTYWKLIDSYNGAISAYRNLRTETIQIMMDFLESMKSYPVLEEYRHIVRQFVNTVKDFEATSVRRTVNAIAAVDDTLRSIRKNYRMNSDELSNKIIDYLQTVRDQPERYLPKATNVQNYITSFSNSVKSSNMADVFTSGIYSVHDMLNSGLASVMNSDDIEHVKSLANNVYQEGKWAYSYWQVEENVQKHLKSIFVMLIEMVQEELENYEAYFDILHKSRVTVMDPEHGEIQVELYLPLPLRSLDTLPEVMPHLHRFKDSVNHYIPNKATFQKYYDDYFPSSFWNKSNDTVNNVWNKELNGIVQRMNVRRLTKRVRRL